MRLKTEDSPMTATSFPGIAPSCPYGARERETPWLGLVSCLKNKINSEEGVLCLSVLCLACFHHSCNDRKSKIDLLTLQL